MVQNYDIYVNHDTQNDVLEFTATQQKNTAGRTTIVALHRTLPDTTLTEHDNTLTLITPLTAATRRTITRVLSGLRHKIRVITDTNQLYETLGYSGVITYTPGANTFQAAPLLPDFHTDTSTMLAGIGAYPNKDGTRNISLANLFGFLTSNTNTTYPLVLDKNILSIISQPIPGFTGHLTNLQEHTIGELSFVANDTQTAKDRRKTKKTLTEKMEKFGFTNLYELLLNPPRHYIDKSKPQNLSDLTLGEEATIIGEIDYIKDLANNAGVLFRINLDGGGSISVSFFKQHWLKTKHPVGTQVLVTGTVNEYRGRLTMTGKTIESLNICRDVPVVPIYAQSPTQGITTKVVSNATRELLTRLSFPGNQRIVTPHYLRAPKIMGFQEALEAIHYPATTQEAYQGIYALAYYELLYTQVLLKDANEAAATRRGVTNTSTGVLTQKVIDTLPYTLTNDQKTVYEKTKNLMGREEPFTGLLSADVGAGKTIIQFLTCLQTVEAGRQAVIIAPTEILVRQLYTNLTRILEDSNLTDTVSTGFLVAGLKAKEKRTLTNSIRDGGTQIIVGTHAALTKQLEFHDLGFVCFDEQQKFGAAQRTVLLDKREDGRVPDFMMATATPIPRSVAQIMFGNITLLEIHEKPAGRKPIRTTWHPEHPTIMMEDYHHPMWEDVRAELDLGHQAFIITPLVEASEKIDAASVTSTHHELTSTVFNGYRVGFAHGKMKRDQQEEVMRAFRAGEYDVLVASTVVEVGVDIPNATRMVILSADRLGASTLHQIRGRVGRNSYDCACYLVAQATSENTVRRLESLVNSQDGFRIAQEDLLNRGEGDVLSSTQAGGAATRFASLRHHAHLLEATSEHADRILGSPYRQEAIIEAKRMFGDVEFLK